MFFFVYKNSNVKHMSNGLNLLFHDRIKYQCPGVTVPNGRRFWRALIYSYNQIDGEHFHGWNESHWQPQTPNDSAPHLTLGFQTPKRYEVGPPKTYRSNQEKYDWKSKFSGQPLKIEKSGVYC